MNDFSEIKYRGLPMRQLNRILSVISLLISVLLLIATGRTASSYEDMRAASENYIMLKQCADDIEITSDYLTEQTKFFVATADMQYMDNYLEEIHVTRRRENALQALLDNLGNTEAEMWAEMAVAQSISLEESEYYAMRLTVEGYGYDLKTLPQEIADVILTPEDAALEPELKKQRAISLLLGESYAKKKDLIIDTVNLCLHALVSETRLSQEGSLEALHRLLQRQRVLVFALIVVVLTVVAATSILLISPLVRGVSHIQNEQPIPTRGAAEFRFLAKTYNMMFEANREKTEQLAYEASHDRLTGLYNRSGYDFLMKNADLETCTLLLIDVDKFKSVNDTYGHSMGDRALARVAAILRENFRDEDYICRIGGDEFAAIMVNSGQQFTQLIHDKITRINEKLLHPDDGLPPLSLSVGVAFGDGIRNSAHLVKNADLALYRVKEAGRCGCAFYEPQKS